MLHSLRLRPWKQWQQLRLQLQSLLLLVAAAVTTVGTAGTAALATTPPVLPAALPAAANATCSRSKHVVLASFGEPEEYHTVSLYFASRFPNANVHHLWLHLEDKGGKKEKKNRQRKSPVDWCAFYRSHGIHRSVIDMASLDAYHELRKTYLHSSINGYEYELLCFARFIGLHEFCSSKGIEQLTWIDADIPIFDPDFLDRLCLPRGYSIWSLTSGSSFLNTMTCSEIGRFVDFMLDFYAKENRPALVRAIHAHGSSDMSRAAHVADQVRQAEPAFAELGIDPKHFSDMFLFSKFLQDTNAIAAVASEEEEDERGEENPTSSKSSPQIPRHPNAYIHQDENGGTMNPYFVPIISIKDKVPHSDSQKLCVNRTVWKQYYSFRGSSSKANTGAMARHPRLGLSFNEGGSTWIPIPGAHFQGSDCKARLLSAFSEEITKDTGDLRGRRTVRV